MTRRSIDILVGLFVLLGLAALGFMALKAANLSTLAGVNTYGVWARFDNIGGLKVRAPVKSAGVVVGRVADITFDMKRYQADVRIDMDDRYRFPTDSSIKILTSGLLGEQYLGIEAGAEEKTLVAGGRISMTQSAVVLENLIGQFLYGKAGDAGADGAGGSNAPK